MTEHPPCCWPGCRAWARGGGYCKFHFFEVADYGEPCSKCGGVDCPADAEVMPGVTFADTEQPGWSGLVVRWKGIEMPALRRCVCRPAPKLR